MHAWPCSTPSIEGGCTDTLEEADVMPTGGEQILEAAAQRRGIRYRMPPDPSGTANLDCSLFIVLTYRDAGFAIPGGARTAEQIRQACSPIDRSEMEAGDLLFFENTYQASGPPGPDGKVASHVGIAIDSTGQQM
jgi:cell wall-associated NlpC family hydrolase